MAITRRLIGVPGPGPLRVPVRDPHIGNTQVTDVDTVILTMTPQTGTRGMSHRSVTGPMPTIDPITRHPIATESGLTTTTTAKNPMVTDYGTVMTMTNAEISGSAPAVAPLTVRREGPGNTQVTIIARRWITAGPLKN